MTDLLLPPAPPGAPLPPWEPTTSPGGLPPRRRGGRSVLAFVLGLIAALAFVSLGAVIGRTVQTRFSTPASSPAPTFFPGSQPGAAAGATPDDGSSPGPSGSSGSAGSSGSSANLSAAAAAVSPATVDITTTIADGSAAGTGIVLTSSGEVLTNNHVIEGATSIRVQVNGSGPTHSARVIGYDISDDVALIQVDNVSGWKTAPIGAGAGVAVGDPVVAVGNALGRPGPPTATPGWVSGLDRSVTATDPGSRAETLSGMIEIQAPLQPGDSGGPLAAANGKVIGVDTAAGGGFRRTATVGYAIPIDAAMTIVHQIESGRSSANVHIGARAMLGVEVREGDGGGALIGAVESGSPADGAGLAAGDAVTSLGGHSIGSASDLTAAMDTHHPGDRVDLKWVDSTGRTRSATVRLTSGPPA